MSDSSTAPPAAASADPLADLARLEGVGSAMAAARDGVDALLRDRGLRRTAPETTAEALLRGAHASAVLAGSPSTLEETRAGTGDASVAAALRLSAGLLPLVPVLRHSPLQVLARLHTLAARGEVADADLGRPVDASAADRLNGLARLLGSPTEAPAMVVAAVAHAELVTIRPFASHHDLVARALERLLLVARGVDPVCVTVPEAGHLHLRASYDAALAAYADGGPGGAHRWLLHAAEAYTAGAQRSPLVG